MSNGLSLKSLAADLLNVCLDKSVELRCSDWEADQLTLEQVLRRPPPPSEIKATFPKPFLKIPTWRLELSCVLPR